MWEKFWIWIDTEMAIKIPLNAARNSCLNAVAPWQDRTEKRSWMISPLLKRTQGCVGCLKIRNFILKINLVLCSANIDSKSNELQKNLKIASKTALFREHFQILLLFSWILALQNIRFFLRTKFLISGHPWIWFSSGLPWTVFGSFLSVC